ncbi:MAG: sigma-70 family RNA polymerase sigma factor [Polyangia bacterium]
MPRLSTRQVDPALSSPLRSRIDEGASPPRAARHAHLHLLSARPPSWRLDPALKTGGLGASDQKIQAEAPQVTALLTAVAGRHDRAAFAAMFEYYSPKLNGYLLARGAPASTAEEIVQEVMLAVWRKAELFDATRGSASAWIFTLARNAFIDRVRRENRPMVDPADPLLSGDRETPGADVMALDAEALRQLAAAVLELPPEQRQVVHRSYFQGQSLAQISAEDGLPIGTVKTRARLALSRLRALVVRRRET